MKIILITLLVLATLALGVSGLYLYFEHFGNPRIAREIADDPGGEQARRVMVLTLPSGRRIPVNYLREGEVVYAGADGSWWKELAGGPSPVTLLLRGETLSGLGRAVLDDPDYTKSVFARLRPKALPGFGTLVEIRLNGETPASGK